MKPVFGSSSGRIRGAFLCACVLFLTGCLADNDSGEPDPGYSDGDWTPVRPVLPKGWPAPQWPKDNPYSSAKAVLGRRLFFETSLSLDTTISCGSCHQPTAGFADAAKRISNGVQGHFTKRNSPSVANALFGSSFMLDGGRPTLESQALAPLFAANEMSMTQGEIEARLAADTAYVRLFRQAYGEGPITLSGVTKALATYQRTLVSYRSAYDRWQAGDEDAVSPAAKRGAALFAGAKTNCRHCHAPPLFTDGDFHDLGFDSALTDRGRAIITGNDNDAGKFKTPSLRDVGVSAPYMHDGSFGTLQEVVEYLNAGTGSRPGTDALLHPLGLTEDEVLDLVAFLESLTDSTLLLESMP
jgi:cytochrome c peroxidase